MDRKYMSWEDLRKIVPRENYQKIESIIKRHKKPNMLLKFVVYHYHTANMLLSKDYSSKNKIDVKLRVELMTLNKQKTNSTISTLIGMSLPPSWRYNFNQSIPSGPLGSWDQNIIDSTVNEVEKHGYCIFKRRLTKDFCRKIISGCQNLNYISKYNNKPIKGIQLKKPVGISHWVTDQRNIFYLPEIQQLLMDPVMLEICKLYLKTTPILTQTNFWWSTTNKQAGTKDYSQMFHQDQDDVKFIKVFIYLNNVEVSNGCHVYVRDSINDRSRLPKTNYKISNRLTDGFIKDIYGEDKIVNLEGPMGTIIFENTNGIHKGQPLIKGYRYLLQLEFGCSTSWYENNSYNLTRNKLTKEMQEWIEKYPIMFLKYNLTELEI